MEDTTPETYKIRTIDTIIKTCVWRIIATILTVTVLLGFTDKTVKLAIGIGMVDSIIKMVVYYFHERAWIKYYKIKTEKKRNESIRANTETEKSA